MTHLERFLTDANVTVINKNKEVRIFIESYNYNTLDDIARTKRYFERLKKYKKGILEKYNLVKHHKHGTHVFYFLNDSDVLSMIDAMIEHVEHTAKEHPTNLY